MQDVSSNGSQFIVYIAVEAIDFNKFSLEAATYVLGDPGFRNRGPRSHNYPDKNPFTYRVDRFRRQMRGRGNLYKIDI